MQFLHRPHLEITHLGLIKTSHVEIFFCVREDVFCEIGVREVDAFLKEIRGNRDIFYGPDLFGIDVIF